MRQAIRAMGVWGAAALAVATGCAEAPADPCAEVSSTCLAVNLTTETRSKADRLRVLIRLDGGPEVERSSGSPDTEQKGFPIAFAVALPEAGADVGLTVVAEASGVPTLRGSYSGNVPAGAHERADIALSPDIGQLPITRPSPRRSPALAYLPSRQSLILFGGVDAQGQFLNDTWEYSSTTKSWTRRMTPAAPGPRIGSLTLDPSSAALILFGGTSPSGSALTDTWAYNGSSWTPLNTTGMAPARLRPGLGYDTQRGGVLLYGGSDPLTRAQRSDSYLLPTTAAWTPISILGVPPLLSSPQLLSSSIELVLLGSDAGPTGKLHAFRTTPVWFELGTPMLAARESFAAASGFPQKDTILVFGGEVQGTVVSDGQIFAPSLGSWTAASSVGEPRARAEAAMTHSPELGGYVLGFGRAASGELLQDLWVYSDRWAPLP